MYIQFQGQIIEDSLELLKTGIYLYDHVEFLSMKCILCIISMYIMAQWQINS